MKVLDLACANQHVFEGWFGSEDDFTSQLSRGLVSCPLCGNATIERRLSAPRLNLGHAKPPKVEAEAVQPPRKTQDVALPAGQGQEAQAALQAAWMELARRVVANTEDVGERFAEEARRIHYGETEHRGIRGQATAAETEALLDEGISVMQMPLPDALKNPLQ